MKKIKLILIGAGQLGVLVSNIIKKDRKYEVVGFIDSTKKKGKKINDIKVLGNDNYLKKLSSKSIQLVICIGDISIRKKIIKKLVKRKFIFPTIIDQNSYVGNKTRIDPGTIICGHTIILNDTKIGKFNIIGTGIKILHNVNIKDNCIIGGGSIIGSNVKISNNVFIGVGSVIASKKIFIEENSFICSGSVILKDVKKNTKVLGNPARVVPYNY